MNTFLHSLIGQRIIHIAIFAAIMAAIYSNSDHRPSFGSKECENVQADFIAHNDLPDDTSIPVLYRHMRKLCR